MRALFYIGAMAILMAVALIYWKNMVGGAIVLCIGVALMMIGLLGIFVNIIVKYKMSQKK